MLLSGTIGLLVVESGLPVMLVVWLRCLLGALGLAALYGLLYGLLSAEDYALLMGSLLVFGLLAGVMLLTRKLDWYALGKPV